MHGKNILNCSKTARYVYSTKCINFVNCPFALQVKLYSKDAFGDSNFGLAKRSIFYYKYKTSLVKPSSFSFDHLIKRKFSSEEFNNESKQLFKQNESSEEGVKKQSWQVVYSGILTTQFRLLKIFSIGTSVVGLSAQPFLYEKFMDANVAVLVSLASIVGFFTFVTPALIHFVCKKYVTKLEYDEETDIYAATTLSFFLREKTIRFHPDEVERPQVPGMFTSFKVNKKALFVDPSTFDDITHYVRLMGYDKPLDISLEQDRKRSEK